jgi:hypothetical protein
MSLDDAIPPTAADLTLREVTRENLQAVLQLKVAPEQEHFVASNAVSIAQAHFYQEVAWFRAIYADETPIGFAMFEQNPEERQYYLWRFMIDARAQGSRLWSACAGIADRPCQGRRCHRNDPELCTRPRQPRPVLRTARLQLHRCRRGRRTRDAVGVVGGQQSAITLVRTKTTHML